MYMHLGVTTLVASLLPGQNYTSEESLVGIVSGVGKDGSVDVTICRHLSLDETCTPSVPIVDPCVGQLCLNRGACIEAKCRCPPGFTGPNCEFIPALSNFQLNGTGLWPSEG
jgi:hypothetical protein